MIPLEQTRPIHEDPGLTQSLEVLDSRLDDAARRQLSYPEMAGGPVGSGGGPPAGSGT